MKNQNLFNRKSIKLFWSLLRNKYSTAEAEFIELDGNQHNQPPRPVSAFALKLKGGPATSRQAGGNVSDIYSILYKIF